jgi:hypothetical protein
MPRISKIIMFVRAGWSGNPEILETFVNLMSTYDHYVPYSELLESFAKHRHVHLLPRSDLPTHAKTSKFCCSCQRLLFPFFMASDVQIERIGSWAYCYQP